MKLRIYGIYRDRKGDKQGPIHFRAHNRDMPWYVKVGEKTWSWSNSGSFRSDGSEHERDLVAEWIEEKDPTPIDLCDLDHFRRGAAKVMGSLSR